MSQKLARNYLRVVQRRYLAGATPPGGVLPALITDSGKPNNTPLAVCLGGGFRVALPFAPAAFPDLLHGGSLAAMLRAEENERANNEAIFE